MRKAKLLLDTNIVVDFINAREPFFPAARKTMVLGRVGELDLWISSSQVADLMYICSNSGRKEPPLLQQLQALRTFVSVYATGPQEMGRMLRTSWANPEDVLLHEVALSLSADAIISRNKADFETQPIKMMDRDELFTWLKDTYNVDYEKIDL